MTQESLILTAADISANPSSAGRILELLAAMARRDHGSVVIRVDFPGEPDGGCVLTPRRMGWASRLCWRVGSRAMGVGL